MPLVHILTILKHLHLSQATRWSLQKLVGRSQWHVTQFLVKECSKPPDIQWRLKSTVGDDVLLGTTHEQHNAFKDGHYRVSNLPKPPNTNHANYTKASSGQPPNNISVCWITDEHEHWQRRHDSQETSLLSEPKIGPKDALSNMNYFCTS
jgi:hypothetical protein